jgi:SseB protein N-terminal domain
VTERHPPHGAAESPLPGAPRFGGLGVPTPDFAGDGGSADPALATLLLAYGAGDAHDRDLVDSLRGARLMVPLVAVLDEVAPTGPLGAAPPGEKDSHMASVSMVGRDGRRALLAFTSVASLAAWDATARGIPARAATVAAAAMEEGADAVLLDVAGPTSVALDGSVLRSVALGQPLPAALDDPDVRAAVLRVLDVVPGLVRADLAAPPVGPQGEVAELLLLVRPEPERDLSHVTQALGAALGADPLLLRRCPRGVALALLPAGS